MRSLISDLHYAWRTLVRSPEYATLTVLTLALGIGANTAVFSVVQGVLLKPLPYPQPDRLLRIFLTDTAFPKFALNPNDFLDYRGAQPGLQKHGGVHPARPPDFRPRPSRAPHRPASLQRLLP